MALSLGNTQVNIKLPEETKQINNKKTSTQFFNQALGWWKSPRETQDYEYVEHREILGSENTLYDSMMDVCMCAQSLSCV